MIQYVINMQDLSDVNQRRDVKIYEDAFFTSKV